MVSENAKIYEKYFNLDEIVESISAYIQDFDIKKFKKAFEFAEIHHRDQFRKSGEPYIVHPVETVKNLIKLHADEETLIAALLHDVPEDTEATIEDVKKEFGDEVAFLVDGITKLSKVYYRNDMHERQIESLKKLLIHTAKDPRVVLIKLADRLHNMQTLEFVPNPEKRIRIAKETLEIYVPIANLLGIQGLKSELEDLCFKHLHSDEFDKLREKILDSTERHKETLKEMLKLISEELASHNIKAYVTGREKSFYSIYKKITSSNKTIDSLHDRIAFRIITEDITDCYSALGVIHNIFTPKPGKFKDYIAVPKINGYQSIHTTVFGLNGIVTEIQIRTEKMHMDSEYGIAAHYFYDESKGHGSEKLIEDQRSNWVSKILDIQRSQKLGEDFMSDLKIDIFQDRIFVFTPSGETLDLPKNATGIDFAYAIHSDLGNHAKNCEVNYEVKPITTVLKTGDYVKIITGSDSSPHVSWLSFAKTSLAKNKIKLFLRKESLKNKIMTGTEMLQKELDRSGLGLVEDINFKKLLSAIRTETNRDFDNRKKLFASIGDGSLQAIEVVKILKSVSNKDKDNNNVFLKISAKNRSGIMKEILNILSIYNADLIFVKGRVSLFHRKAFMFFYINFSNLNEFSEICQQIEQLDGVEKVYRSFRWGMFSFYSVSIATLAFWIFHPIFINSISQLRLSYHYRYFSEALLYLGLFMLLFTVVYLKKIIRKTFPGIRDDRWLWGVTFFTSTVAVIALIVELYIFEIYLNWIVMFFGVLFMYTYLALEFLDYKKFKLR